MKPQVETVRSLAAPDDGTTTNVARGRTVECYDRTVRAEHSGSRPKVNPAALQQVEIESNFSAFAGKRSRYARGSTHCAGARIVLFGATLCRPDPAAVAIRTGPGRRSHPRRQHGRDCGRYP